MKQKKCSVKACRKLFTPRSSTQQVCSWECAKAHTDALKAKKAASDAKASRVEHRAAKAKLKTRGDYAGEAQSAINAYRRDITRELGCISCGTHNGKMNGGHYRSVGGAVECRFIEINIWCQCERCNSYLSGNLIEYRKRLLSIIGDEKMAWLEGKHEIPHHTIDELKQIKAKYSKLARELKNKLTTY
jgi:hypothetical protein